MIDCSKCPNPGSCCGIFRMNKEWAKKHEKDFQIKPSKIVDQKDFVAFLTDDMFCIFLNRETKLCSIYEDRPDVCRLSGSSRHPDLQCPYFKRSGNPRSSK